MSEPADLSFLAAPGELADWRMVLAYEAAASAGVLDALPGTATEIARRCELDEGALRAVLGPLTAWGVLDRDERDHFSLGPRAPAPPQDAILVVHATTIRRWAALIGPRLRDRTAVTADAPARPSPSGHRLDLLALNARRISRSLVDASLEAFPDARRVLDLGGGHGEHAIEFTRRGLHATMQDREEVIALAGRDSALTGAGVQLFGGDFLTALPDGPFDLVLIAGTTNMFDGPTNLALYRRLQSVIAPGGGLVIASYLRGRDEVTASFGLQMLAWTDGGDAHELADYRSWLDDAGYGPAQVRELDDPPLTVVLAAR